MTQPDTLRDLLVAYDAADTALYDFGRKHPKLAHAFDHTFSALCRARETIRDQIDAHVLGEMRRLGTAVGWAPTRGSVRSIRLDKQPDSVQRVVFSPCLYADRNERTPGRAMFPHVHVCIPSTAAIPAAVEFFNGMVAREVEMQRATRAALAEFNRTVGNRSAK